MNKLATDVPASTAPETGIKKLIYNTVYDAIYNLTAKDDREKDHRQYAGCKEHGAAAGQRRGEK